MAFELFLSKNLRRQKQFAPYIPFCNDENLPPCTIRVYEAEVDEEYYQKAGLAFETYLDQEDAKVITERDYHILAYQDGVIIQSKEKPDGIVYVHDDFKRMDAVGDTMHASVTMFYDTLLCGYQYVCAQVGALLMHASSVIVHEEAICFCGISGAGKSTQAEGWVREKSARPINYDHPCIIWEGDTPVAYGSPWGGKEKYCQPVSAPVKAFVFVRKSETDSIRKMSMGEAFANLLLNNAMPHVCPEIQTKYRQNVLKLVEKIPVYEQFCTRSGSARELLYSTLFGE